MHARINAFSVTKSVHGAASSFCWCVNHGAEPGMPPVTMWSRVVWKSSRQHTKCCDLVVVYIIAQDPTLKQIQVPNHRDKKSLRLKCLRVSTSRLEAAIPSLCCSQDCYVQPPLCQRRPLQHHSSTGSCAAQHKQNSFCKEPRGSDVPLYPHCCHAMRTCRTSPRANSWPIWPEGPWKQMTSIHTSITASASCHPALKCRLV